LARAKNGPNKGGGTLGGPKMREGGIGGPKGRKGQWMAQPKRDHWMGEER